MITQKLRPTIGTCEVCDKPDVEVWKSPYGNVMLCAGCKQDEQDAVAKSDTAKRALDEFKRVDSSITVKADIHLVKPVPIIELRAAIFNDPQYKTDEDREHAFTKECQTHVRHLQTVIFTHRQELLAEEAELRTWQVNGQESAGKLRAELRAQFHELDINYVPAPITKKQKTTKPVSTKSKFNKTEFYAALNKFGVSAYAAQVRQAMVSKNMTPEDAAKYFAELMGLL